MKLDLNYTPKSLEIYFRVALKIWVYWIKAESYQQFVKDALRKYVSFYPESGYSFLCLFWKKS